MVEFLGGVVRETGAGFDFYERAHVLPQSAILTVGNPRLFEVFSGHRFVDITWTAATVAGVDTGVTITTVPFSYIIRPTNSNYETIAEATETGSPVVNTFIRFSFIGETVDVPITVTRFTVFPYQPEREVAEEFSFLTDVLTTLSGKENRLALRKTPRHRLTYAYNANHDLANRIRNIMFTKQGLKLGIGIWSQQTRLTSNLLPGALTAFVEDTESRNFFEGGFVLIYMNDSHYDFLQVESFTNNTITFTSGPSKGYTQYDPIMPGDLAITRGQVSTVRYPVNMETTELTFESTEGGTVNPDLLEFPSFVMLPSTGTFAIEDKNFLIGPTNPNAWERRVSVQDNLTGVISSIQIADVNKHQWEIGFSGRDLFEIWRLKQIFYGLVGRQKAFYIRSFRPDFMPLEGIVGGNFTMNVENRGYARNNGDQAPREWIRIGFNDGSFPIYRRITSTEEIDDDVEQIRVSPGWTFTKALSTIDTIEILEFTRLASDTLRIVREGAQRWSARLPLISLNDTAEMIAPS